METSESDDSSSISQSGQNKINRRKWLATVGSAAIIAGCSGDQGDGGSTSGGAETTIIEEGAPPVPTISSTDLDFAQIPFQNTVTASIGAEMGWYNEVGITLQPEETSGQHIETSNNIPILSSGDAEIVTVTTTDIAGAVGSNPDVRLLHSYDVFQGHHIVAQPDMGYTSYDEFVEQGMEPAEAIGAVAEQLNEGSTIGLAGSASYRNFLDIILSYSDNVSRNTIDFTQLDATQHVSAMEADRADFEIGGAPYQVALINDGYKPIINSNALVQGAEAQRGSDVAQLLLKDGFAATTDWIENNRRTILRFLGVSYKIGELLDENPQDGAEIATPFLNQHAGTDLTVEEGATLFEDFHPYFTFEEQESWYNNTDDPLYYQYHTGTKIDQAVENGILEEGEWEVEEISLASEFYAELQELKESAESNMEEASSLIEEGSGENIDRAEELLSTARRHHELYNFYDADRFSESAVEWAEYSG